MAKRIFALAMCLAGMNAAALDFEWAFPKAPRQTWRAIVPGNGKFVGITDAWGGRVVFVSRDGRNLTQPAGVPRTWLEDLKFVDGEFIAVGRDRAVFTSADGENWTTHESLPTDLNFGIARGNGATVVVSYYGYASVSTDMREWKPINAFVGSPFEANGKMDVTFGNGVFVAASLWRIWTSVNGTDWVERPTLPQPCKYSSLVFSNGRFAMNFWDSAADGVYTSTDGVEWTRAGTLSFGLHPAPNGFLGTHQDLWKSADGSAWEKILDYPEGDQMYLTAAAEMNGIYVAGGARGILLVSEDGKTWEEIVPPLQFVPGLNLAFGNGEFLMFHENGLSISKAGEVWENIPGAPSIRSAAYGNGLWVATTLDGGLAFSADARDWTTNASPIPARKVHYAQGVFLVEPSDGSAGLGFSRDGKTWRRIDIPGSAGTVIYGNVNGRWAALAGGRPATSEDGETWTVHPADPDIRSRLVAAGNGRFLSFGGAGMGPGTVAWSFDGVNWESEICFATTHIEVSMAFGGGVFLLTDNYGDISTSADGRVWSGMRQAELPFQSAAYGDGKWLVAGANSVLRSVPANVPNFSLRMNLSGPFWYLILQSEPGKSFEVQSATSVVGPWQSIGFMDLNNDSYGMWKIDTTNSGAFFRASVLAQ